MPYRISALQHIANTTHSLDQLGIARLILDLLAQVADIDLDNIGLTHEIIAPDAVQDGLPVQYLARMGHKQVKKIILGCGTLDDPVAPSDLTRRLIQRQIRHSEDTSPWTTSGH